METEKPPEMKMIKMMQGRMMEADKRREAMKSKKEQTRKKKEA